MPDPNYFIQFARYNRWANARLYAACAALPEQAYREDRGAFFGSIHGTLSHLVWGDQQWMSRFAPALVEKPPPLVRQSPGNYPAWEDLKARRRAGDATILRWVDALEPAWLAGTLTWYSGLAKADVTKPVWVLVTHFFNHQTHHRGQVHAMLTAAGAMPDDTDLMLMQLP